MVWLLCFGVIFAADPSLQPMKQQVTDLQLIIEELEVRYPDELAAAQHETHEMECKQALIAGPTTSPAALESCIKVAEFHEVDLADAAALYAHYHERYPTIVHPKDAMFWVSAFQVVALLHARECMQAVTEEPPAPEDTASDQPLR